MALLSFVAWTVPIRADAPEQGPLHITFSPRQLQGETNIWQIIQTKDGQVVAGGERISFYQDNHWQFLSQIRKPAIRCLFEDGNTLWVASTDEIGSLKLPLDSNSRYDPLRVPALAHAGIIWHIARSGNQLVATTKEDLWFIDPKTGDVQRTNLPTKQRLFLLSLGGRLIVEQVGVAFWEVRDGQLLPFETPLPDKTDLLWLWSDSNHLATTRALYLKSESGYRAIAELKTIHQAVITSMVPWGKNVAVGTYANGLALIDPETGDKHFVTRASGLPTLGITCLSEDKDGRLWVGTNQGITVFDSLRYGHHLAANEYPLAATRADGGLLINYEGQADWHWNDGHEEKISRTYALVPTPRGLAIGLWSKVRLGTRDFPTPGNKVDLIAALPDGNLLAAAGERLYSIEYETGRSELVNGPHPEFSGFATIGTTLWAAAFDGTLYRSPVAPPFSFTKVATLPNGVAATLHHLGSTLLVASSDGVRFGGEFQPVEHTQGLRNPRLASNDDGLWLVGDQDDQRRLGRLRAAGDSVVWDVVEAKGLPLLSEIHAFTASGHSLMFCGDSTILELDARELTPATRLATPRLSFTFQDPATGATTTLATPPDELPADKNSFLFSGVLAFDEFGEEPRLERRLLPTETTWTAAKLGETVSYPSLSPRTYTLEVRATHLGHTGPVVAHTFAVLPPWYATGSAAAGYVALAALGFFGIYRLRTRQIRRRTAELERIVEERTHALKEASEAKTEFLASMSHEIRNPMNGVIGLVDILREQPALPRQADTLRLLHHCADQLRTTVDDILDFSKIEAGRVELEAVAFDLRDTLEAAAVTIDPTGEKISFIDKPPHGIVLVGDVGKLRQIYANYLSNALKYGVPPAARVSLLLTPIPGDGLRLTLGVASSGPTIPKDTLDKFFDSFTRGTEAIERNIHGTGLGLAICRKFAQAMDGEVGAVSANGETTFYINVPFARATPDALTPAAAAAPNTLPAKALAIEDEDYNRIVLGSILAKMNYTVDWATTGAEALKLAQENGYDIILTDYRLPDTNGVELTKKILKFCPDPKPAVFAVTAYSTKERRDECLNAGMVGFISKPITLEKLRSTLAGWGEKNLAKISLEAGRQLGTVFMAQPPADIAAAWDELQRTVPIDAKKAADLAHRLNNLCRAHGLIDVAEQLELLEGALERGEPAEPFLRAGEALLRG